MDDRSYEFLFNYYVNDRGPHKVKIRCAGTIERKKLEREVELKIKETHSDLKLGDKINFEYSTFEIISES